MRDPSSDPSASKCARPKVLVIDNNLDTGPWVCRSLLELGLTATWMDYVPKGEFDQSECNGTALDWSAINPTTEPEPIHVRWADYSVIFLSDRAAPGLFWRELIAPILAAEVPLIATATIEEESEEMFLNGADFRTTRACSPKVFKNDVRGFLRQLNIPTTDA